MPMYEWKCKKCDKHVGVLRSFDDYQDPPEKDETPECKTEKSKHEWERVIRSGNIVRGPNWGVKGSLY